MDNNTQPGGMHRGGMLVPIPVVERAASVETTPIVIAITALLTSIISMVRPDWTATAVAAVVGAVALTMLGRRWRALVSLSMGECRINLRNTAVWFRRSDTGAAQRTLRGRSARAISAFVAGILATVSVQNIGRLSADASDIASRIQGPPTMTFASLVQRVDDEDYAAGNTKPNADIARLFATEALSPLGRASAGIMREDALAFADRHLRGVNGARQNRVEAAYWLKHALASPMKDPLLTWALTQLGSVLAVPDSGRADYRAARTVWKISASLGDPIASCFLGRMHEYGVGVGKDRDAARALYSQALSAGGCPGLAQSLGRL